LDFGGEMYFGKAVKKPTRKIEIRGMLVDQDGAFESKPGDARNRSDTYGRFLVKGKFDIIRNCVSWKEIFYERKKPMTINFRSTDLNEQQNRISGTWDWTLNSKQEMFVTKRLFGVKDANLND
jgi:hypothetical protein